MRFASRVLATLSLSFALAAPAQTLAHKGWAGSGLTVDPWWQGAIFYIVDPTHLAGLTERLPYLQSLGVDAMIVPSFASSVAQPAPAEAEEFDRLESEAGRHKIRILVDLPLKSEASLADTDTIARFWLSRGVAGLRLVRTPETPADPSTYLRDLRRITASYGGQRVLLWDAGSIAIADPPARRRTSRRPAPQPATPDLTVDRNLELLGSLAPPGLRAALAGPTTGVAVATDSGQSASFEHLGETIPIARLLATALLAGRGAPLLYGGQEVGKASSDSALIQEDSDPGSLVNWYRKLADLHHGNVALRTGLFDLVPTSDPDLVIWVRRPRLGGAPVLAVLNTSATTTHLTSLPLLAGELRRLGINGAMLKTLATTEADTTTPTPNTISLAPFGAFLGEIRASAGLETIVLPVRHPVSHRRQRKDSLTR